VTSPRMKMKLLNALAFGKVGSMVRGGVWLTVLVAACSSPVFAQHGIQEFTANGTFTVPAGVSELRVDAYGGGGGGGGADGSTQFGGGGGGAAYNAGVVTVSPGEVLTIMVGSGGKGGLAGNPAQAGAAGGTTKILNSSKVVLFAANGGKGGQGATSTANGSSGVGGAAGSFGSIRHVGQGGLANSAGYGYVPLGFSNNSNDAFGIVVNPGFGAGGNGGSGGFSGGNGFSGSLGYMLISW
jgi:hypothetical protein